MKADQRARGRYLGGRVPFGYALGEMGIWCRIQTSRLLAGRPLRAIAKTMREHRVSHKG